MEENILLKIRDLHIRFTQYDRGLKRRELHPVRGLSCDVEKGKLTAVVGAAVREKAFWPMRSWGFCLITAVWRARSITMGSGLTAGVLRRFAEMRLPWFRRAFLIWIP